MKGGALIDGDAVLAQAKGVRNSIWKGKNDG
jgi:hypothetical protein